MNTKLSHNCLPSLEDKGSAFLASCLNHRLAVPALLTIITFQCVYRFVMPGTPLSDIRFVECDEAELEGTIEEVGAREDVEIVEQLDMELITTAQPMAREDRVDDMYYEDDDVIVDNPDEDDADNGNDVAW